jgi:hypothetical protein
MTLTGTPLLVTLVVLTVVLPFVIVWGWSRVGGPRWLVRGEHVAMILVAQVSALLVAAVALNDYGDFFSSWSQAAGAFFGTAPKTALGNQGLGDLSRFGATAPPALRVAHRADVRVASSDQLPAGMTPTSWSTPAQYGQRGAVGTLTLYGPQSQLSNRVAVYLPPDYFAGNRSLPLLVAITGYPSTYHSLTGKLALPSRLIAGIDAHTMAQMVVVMAPAGLPYPLDSECTDAPGGPFAFTWFDKDVPTVIEQLTGLQPPAIGALGYSTGGYCAVKLAMLDPTRFTAAVSMSGYFHAQPGKYSPRMFAGSRRLADLNNLRWRLQHLPAPRTSVLVMTGTQEIGADGWVNNNAFLRAVRAPMYAERFIVPVDYGHSYGTWSQEVSPALVWMSRSLGATRSAGGIGSALFSQQGLRGRQLRHHPSSSPAASPPASPSGRHTRRP